MQTSAAQSDITTWWLLYYFYRIYNILVQWMKSLLKVFGKSLQGHSSNFRRDDISVNKMTRISYFIRIFILTCAFEGWH